MGRKVKQTSSESSNFANKESKREALRCALSEGKLKKAKYIVEELNITRENLRQANDYPIECCLDSGFLAAVQNGHANVVSYLLSSFDFDSSSLNWAFRDAIKIGNLEIAKLMYPHLKDINKLWLPSSRNTAYLYNMLDVAASLGHSGCVKFLLEKMQFDSNGEQLEIALKLAKARKYHDIAKMIESHIGHVSLFTHAMKTITYAYWVMKKPITRCCPDKKFEDEFYKPAFGKYGQPR